MSDAELLYVVLAALYLLESLAFVGPAAWVVQQLLPGRWRVTRPVEVAARWEGAVALGAPWPPLGPTFVCEPWPLPMGAEGVRSAAGPDRVVPWADLSRAERQGRVVLHDGEPLGRLSSQRGAASALAQLRALADRGGDGIERVLAASLSVATAKDRLATFQRGTRALRIVESLLLITVFGGGAILLWTPWSVLWRELGAAGLVLFVAGAVCARRAVRSVLPPEAQPTLAARAALLVSPLSTMRAHDTIAREVMGDLHPLAVAAAVGAPIDDLARHLYARVRWPARPMRQDGTRAQDPLATAHAAATAAALERFAEARGLDLAALVAAPEPQGRDIVGWCPHCRGQYVRLDDGCTSCPGAPLLRFDRPPEPP